MSLKCQDDSIDYTPIFIESVNYFITELVFVTAYYLILLSKKDGDEEEAISLVRKLKSVVLNRKLPLSNFITESVKIMGYYESDFDSLGECIAKLRDKYPLQYFTLNSSSKKWLQDDDLEWYNTCMGFYKIYRGNRLFLDNDSDMLITPMYIDNVNCEDAIMIKEYMGNKTDYLCEDIANYILVRNLFTNNEPYSLGFIITERGFSLLLLMGHISF